MRILIVDDEPGMIETLSDILELEGVEVFKIESGLDAVEFIRGNTIDLILMDFKMPGMNGVEAYKKIKKNNNKVKVIFITAYYQEQLIQKALEEGAFGICHKPLHIPQLLDMIRVPV